MECCWYVSGSMFFCRNCADILVAGQIIRRLPYRQGDAESQTCLSQATILLGVMIDSFTELVSKTWSTME